MFLRFGNAPRWIKIAGTGGFIVSVYLQFFSAFPLTGLLLQVALALLLALWRKLDGALGRPGD